MKVTELAQGGSALCWDALLKCLQDRLHTVCPLNVQLNHTYSSVVEFF